MCALCLDVARRRLCACVCMENHGPTTCCAVRTVLHTYNATKVLALRYVLMWVAAASLPLHAHPSAVLGNGEQARECWWRFSKLWHGTLPL